jgi:hypothetical protein
MSEPTPAPADTPSAELLTRRYADQIAGTLGCWDRVIITGTPALRFTKTQRWERFHTQTSLGSSV